MTNIDGIWWPDGIEDHTRQHALKHVKSLEWAIARCKQKRTAVQAGGNIGLWPRRLGGSFVDVLAFEPDETSRLCMVQNVPDNVDIYPWALGDKAGVCGMSHRGLGSHSVVEGSSVQIQTIDGMCLQMVDLIQLDIEGYEWNALAGAVETIARCKPLIQVELRDNLLAKYGQSSASVRKWLEAVGYHQVSAQAGSDYVFEHTKE